MKAKKEALDDAISATKAAVSEGIVPGGGLALLRCMQAVSDEEARSEGDEKTGVQILKRALSAPARQIADNSAVDGGVVVAKMLEGQGNFGFDAARNTYVDLVEAGIIDPTKVVRVALENAVSVAGVLLLTEATMTELPERKKEVGARAGAGIVRRVMHAPILEIRRMGAWLRRPKKLFAASGSPQAMKPGTWKSIGTTVKQLFSLRRRDYATGCATTAWPAAISHSQVCASRT